MIRNLFLLACLLISLQVFAQTGIGTTTPDPSAKLHVNATDKGFLPPRVALTSTNSANPIVSPANGLMVFNTVSAGASPFNVVPGFYYWDGTGQKWVSISTTVGNVQNQAIFRSTSNTSAGSVITSWNARFNNISSGDLTITSLTEFALSNGIYKIEWALPFQSSNTYNTMVLQELSSGSWGTFRGDAAYASLSNGGNTDWGGGTYAADILDCSSAPKTIRIINNDGASRTLFKGVTLIITKLNPSVTTSTTADNLGNHIATSNIQLNNNYLSNDGGNEGIRVDNTGNVGIGTSTPGDLLVVGSSIALHDGGDKVVGMGWSPGSGKAILAGYPAEIRLNPSTGKLSLGIDPTSRSIGSAPGVQRRMTITSAGNTGIGTEDPTEKLEVIGNVKATNFIGTASSTTLYLLEANSNANYTLPGPWINDLCRYNNVNNTINVPSSWFNTSNYRFTPQKAGYWEIIANYDVYRNAESYLFLQKNGSTVAQTGAFNLISAMVNKIVYLNGSSDYITVVNQGGAAYARNQNTSTSWFQARWVGE